MKPLPPLATAAAVFAFALGLPFGLYVLLTRQQRRTTREIRDGAAAHGWRYRARRWQGNPAAFRINGQTRSGLTWILTSENTLGYDRDWSVRLHVLFPVLGGEADLAVLPRGSGELGSAPAAPVPPPGIESRVAAVSSAAASTIGFSRVSREFPSGFPAFDAAYRVLALPQDSAQPPIDPALAARMMQWPADAIAPHSVLAWRDPLGFQVQARLPASPNWATVAYFLAIAEALTARLPPAVPSTTPPGFVDRLVGRLLRS